LSKNTVDLKSAVFSCLNIYREIIMQNLSTESQQTTAEQPEPPSVNVQDLLVLRSCIQLACGRGAYRAEEMLTIGTAYNRLDAFLKHVETPHTSADAESATSEQTQGE
jgi:hypothetical protein